MIIENDLSTLTDLLDKAKGNGKGKSKRAKKRKREEESEPEDEDDPTTPPKSKKPKIVLTSPDFLRRYSLLDDDDEEDEEEDKIVDVIRVVYWLSFNVHTKKAMLILPTSPQIKYGLNRLQKKFRITVSPPS